MLIAEYSYNANLVNSLSLSLCISEGEKRQGQTAASIHQIQSQHYTRYIIKFTDTPSRLCNRVKVPGCSNSSLCTNLTFFLLTSSQPRILLGSHETQ